MSSTTREIYMRVLPAPLEPHIRAKRSRSWVWTGNWRNRPRNSTAVRILLEGSAAETKRNNFIRSNHSAQLIVPLWRLCSSGSSLYAGAGGEVGGGEIGGKEKGREAPPHARGRFTRCSADAGWSGGGEVLGMNTFQTGCTSSWEPEGV